MQNWRDLADNPEDFKRVRHHDAGMSVELEDIVYFLFLSSGLAHIFKISNLKRRS
jgi:hypothetical protein